VTLTVKGRAALRRAPRAPQERLVEGIGRLRPAERERLASSLSALVRAMKIHGKDAAMFFADEPAPRPAKRRARARS
jgi:hypothetical protein